SRVLAGEANSPGSFSRKTVNLLADLDRSDAELFTNLCRHVWTIEDSVVPLIFNAHDSIYLSSDVNFESGMHLENLGLVVFSANQRFGEHDVPRTLRAAYYDRSLELSLTNAGDTLELGMVLLSRAGEQLAGVCGSIPVDGFFDFVCDRWARLGYM